MSIKLDRWPNSVFKNSPFNELMPKAWWNRLTVYMYIGYPVRRLSLLIKKFKVEKGRVKTEWILRFQKKPEVAWKWGLIALVANLKFWKRNCWKGRCKSSGFEGSISCLCCLLSTTRIPVYQNPSLDFVFEVKIYVCILKILIERW